MTKSEALHKWMSSHGLTAYPMYAVPNDAELPYLTYSKGFSPDGYAAAIHLYYRTSSEAVPDAKTEEICEKLRCGGSCTVNYDVTNEGATTWYVQLSVRILCIYAP